MLMVKLTQSDTGKPVYVNPEFVARVDEDANGGSRIMFAMTPYCCEFVTEKPEIAVSILNHGTVDKHGVLS